LIVNKRNRTLILTALFAVLATLLGVVTGTMIHGATMQATSGESAPQIPAVDQKVVQTAAVAPESAKDEVLAAKAYSLTIQQEERATGHFKREYRWVEFFDGQEITGELTHYCACAKCNGAENAGVNALGKPLADGMVGCNWLPLGTAPETATEAVLREQQKAI
jgi:hypothetical protein